MRRAWAAAAAVALLATGCGSTVQLRGSATTGSGPGGTGLELPGPASATPGSSLPAGAVTSAPDGPSTPGPVTPGDATPSTSGAGVTGGAGSGTVQSGRSGIGVTAREIRIGYFYFAGTEEGTKSLGLNVVSFGDPAAQARAVVDAINRKGGIAGRKVVLEVYGSPPTTTASFDQQYQQICDHFTQDVKVFAVLPAKSPVMRACLAKRGVVAIGSSLDDVGAAEYRADPSYLDSLGFTPDAAMANLVDALKRTGYLTGKWDSATGEPGLAPVTLGVIYPDTFPWRRAVKEQLLPALRAAGAPVSDANVFEYHQNTSANEVGTTISQIQSAVVKFRGNGVTHVIPVETNGLGFFAQGARSQGYRPRYAVSSANSPKLQVESGAVRPDQLRGALGFGWQQSIDVDKQPAGAPAGQGRCLTAMRAAHVDVSTYALKAAAFATCDLVYLLQAGLEAVPATTPWSRPSLARAVESLGGSFPFAVLVHGSYGVGKHYPVDTGWTMVFDETCTCMAYVGSATRLR